MVKLRGRSRGQSEEPERMSPDDTYLTYHDVRLTNEDVYTLRRDWLTDNVISFWEEYLEQEYLAHCKTSGIVLLRPSMSFLLSQTPDPQTLKGALPDFSETSHIFLPVNDCRDVSEAEGGTHWSLLLVSVVDGIAFHYDSLPPGNQTEAFTLREKLGLLLDRPLRFMQLTDSPEQENGSDCGVFVCMFMRDLLLKRLLLANQSQQISMSLGGLEMDAEDGRRQILRAIEKFKRKSGSWKLPYVPMPSLHTFNVVMLCSVVIAFVASIVGAVSPLFVDPSPSELWSMKLPFTLPVDLNHLLDEMVPTLSNITLPFNPAHFSFEQTWHQAEQNAKAGYLAALRAVDTFRF